MRAIQTDISQPTPCAIPVAIYTRVSTMNQVGGRFDSCESQAAICREHIQKHAGDGWFEAACYSDPAYSGSTLKRPGMEALMRHIAAGGIKIVLIFKFERVLRSTDEWAPFRAFLKKHGCRLESPMENLSEDTAMDRFNNNLRANLAEFDRLNTAEKVQAKMLAQAKRGYWNYGPIPYGYAYDPQAKRLNIDPTEANIVRRVFKQAAALVPLTQIANALCDDGLRTRVRIFKMRDGTQRNVGGKRFRSDSLRHLLRNSIYAGRIRFHGKEYPGQHEALVSDELWDRANAAISKVRPARALLRSRDKHVHLLKGILFCQHCGRALMPSGSGKCDPTGKPYRYYTCGAAQKERAAWSCPVRHLSAPLVEDCVVALLGEIVKHPTILETAVEHSHLRGKTDRRQLAAQLAQADQALGEINRQLRNCVDAIASGSADQLADELRERAGELKEQKQARTVEREQARQELVAGEQDEVDAQRIREALGKFAGIFPALPREDQKRLVALCLARIEVRVRKDTAAVEGVRRFALRLHLLVSQLVDSMEQQVIFQRRDGGDIPMIRRVLMLESTIEISAGGAAAIRTPFEHEVRQRRPKATPPAPAPARHALHRARRWDQVLTTSPRLTWTALAKREGLTLATVSYHLMLLRLAPEIQRFLVGLTDGPSIRFFGLVRMKEIARRSLPEQRRLFATIRDSFKRQTQDNINPPLNDATPFIGTVFEHDTSRTNQADWSSLGVGFGAPLPQATRNRTSSPAGVRSGKGTAGTMERRGGRGSTENIALHRPGWRGDSA